MFILFALIYTRALSVGLHCEQTILTFSSCSVANFFYKKAITRMSEMLVEFVH